jgi:hypothetical protein
MTAQPKLTAFEAEQLIRGFTDHEKFCSRLKIRAKSGETVPYVMSPGGRKLNRAIRKQEAAGLPVRIVCLKASQVWMSSSTATEIFRRVPFFPGRRALVLADSEFHSDLVFDYYQQYRKSYEQNPYGEELDAAIRLPELVKDTERHIRWANDSSIMVGTAANVDIVRAAPFMWLQLSEAAFYRSLSALMTGAMQRVPQSPHSGVIVETTANGQGGDFYDLWNLAVSGKSGWLAVFFAYWEHPENRMDPATLGYKDAAAFQSSLTRLEWQEQKKYNLTLHQLAWRRYAIETLCEGSLDRFQQEHPGSPEEAFVATGRTIFDMAAVGRLQAIRECPRGRLEAIDTGTEKRVQFLPNEDGRGELQIYRMPRVGGRYIIGSDHAEGIDPSRKAGGKSDPDFCSASVGDADTGEQVAKIKGRYEPGPWAERLYWLGRFYNWAYMVPEAKAVGKAVIERLLAMEGTGYPVELIYSRQRAPDDKRPALLQELGYETNPISRPVLISGLDTALRLGSIQIHCPETIMQLREFVRKANGREEGIGHDDDVLAEALRVEGHKYAARIFAYREEQRAGGQMLAKPFKYGVQVRRSGDDD